MASSTFDEADILEFKNEALEMLEECETRLLEIDKTGGLTGHYDAIFRVFHSLKGGAGMLGMEALQSHMHQIENLFQKFKGASSMGHVECTYFLAGVDAARAIFDGKAVQFVYEINSTPPPTKPVPSSSTPSTETQSATTKATAPAAKTVAPTKPAPGSAGLVYAVDDEPEITELIATFLLASGYAVETFNDPRVALERFKAHRPEVLLTDLRMPGMTGVELLAQAHKIDPLVSVVFLSAHVSKDILIESLGYGVHSVIEKPFSEDSLLAACATAAKRSQLLKLLNRSVHLLLYQFSDLDQYLESQGKDEVRKSLRTEMDQIISAMRQLRG